MLFWDTYVSPVLSLQLNLELEVRFLHSGVPTRVIEWHQYVGGRLLLGSFLVVDDIKGDSLSLRNVIGHAASGVDDKTQHRRASDTH